MVRKDGFSTTRKDELHEKESRCTTANIGTLAQGQEAEGVEEESRWRPEGLGPP